MPRTICAVRSVEASSIRITSNGPGYSWRRMLSMVSAIDCAWSRTYISTDSAGYLASARRGGRRSVSKLATTSMFIALGTSARPPMKKIAAMSPTASASASNQNDDAHTVNANHSTMRRRRRSAAAAVTARRDAAAAGRSAARADEFPQSVRSRDPPPLSGALKDGSGTRHPLSTVTSRGAPLEKRQGMRPTTGVEYASATRQRRRALSFSQSQRSATIVSTTIRPIRMLDSPFALM